MRISSIKSNSKRIAQQDRSVNNQCENRKGQNGSQNADHAPDAIVGIGLNNLGKELRPIPLFEYAVMTGDYGDKNSKFNYLMKTVDTFSKQLQCIEDLYLIVKAQPRYKNLKEPNWSEDTNPLQIIYWLLRKLSPLARGESWTVDTYNDNGKIRFRFVTYKYYNSNELKNREEFIPMDFLPMLKKRDLPLHNMIIDTVALVSKINKVPLWDEDGDFSEGLKELSNSTFLSKSVNRQMYSYIKGTAANYLKHIKNRRKVVTREILLKQFNSYIANSERKRSMIWWVRRALDLTSYNQTIQKNTYIPNFMPCNVVSPYRMYKFVWSLHDNDILKKKAWRNLKIDDQYGSYLPLKFSIAKPGEVLLPIVPDPFPLRLYEFMSYGHSAFLWRHRQYFYKNMLNEQLTPSESFLEKIDLHDINN
ncbi:MAG: hypothetical protein ABFD07_00435 [Methanobacterium sp.]